MIDIEASARNLCNMRGQDPDERVQYADPSGYAINRYTPRWELAQKEIVNFLNLSNCLINEDH